ncbi:hypothetical protein ES705_18381 [subsurface metagenome]
MIITFAGGEMVEFTRRERRELTLKQAKRIARKRGMTRQEMFRYRDELIKAFPKGTVDFEERVR